MPKHIEYEKVLELFPKVEGCTTMISVQDLEKVPTANVIPVAEAHWDEYGNCSNCSKNIYDDIDADIWSAYRPPHCPNCAAKMDNSNVVRKHCNPKE